MMKRSIMRRAAAHHKRKRVRIPVSHTYILNIVIHINDYYAPILGEFEQLVLLALLRLGNGAYGAALLSEIREPYRPRGRARRALHDAWAASNRKRWSAPTSASLRRNAAAVDGNTTCSIPTANARWAARIARSAPWPRVSNQSWIRYSREN